MTYGSRGLVGGHCRVVGGMFRGQSARWRRTVRRTLRKFTRAEGNRIWLTVRTADGPRTLRGQSGQLGFWGSGRSAHVLRTVRRTNFGWTRAARSDQLVAPIDCLAPPACILQNCFEALHSALCHDLQGLVAIGFVLIYHG